MGTSKQLPCRLQLKALRVKRTADTVTYLKRRLPAGMRSQSTNTFLIS